MIRTQFRKKIKWNRVDYRFARELIVTSYDSSIIIRYSVNDKVFYVRSEKNKMGYASV